MSKLVNIATACEFVGCGRSKLYELLDAGELESVKLGRRRLVPEDALDEFVERLRSSQAAPGRPAA